MTFLCVLFTALIWAIVTTIVLHVRQVKFASVRRVDRGMHPGAYVDESNPLSREVCDLIRDTFLLGKTPLKPGDQLITTFHVDLDDLEVFFQLLVDRYRKTSPFPPTVSATSLKPYVRG